MIRKNVFKPALGIGPVNYIVHSAITCKDYSLTSAVSIPVQFFHYIYQ